MPTFRLRRTDEFSNKWRDYRIFIDGQQVGTIANGEIKDFELSPGKHTIIAKIDWCSSPEVSVDVAEHQTKRLTVGGFRNGQWLMPLGMGLIVCDLLVSNFADFHYTAILLVPLFLLLLYYLTLGRNNYLTLVEAPEH